MRSTQRHADGIGSSAHVDAQEDSRREAEPQLARHRARQRLVRDRLELLAQRGPRATRKHLSISASIDGGTMTSIHSTSSTALRASVVHLLAVVLIDVDS
jgi:hypothetical protein